MGKKGQSAAKALLIASGSILIVLTIAVVGMLIYYYTR